MTETKKNSTKKVVAEPIIDEETKEETVEEVVETKAEPTFAEKSAEAAATAALKAAIETNNEIAIRESEKAYFIEKKNYMLNKCKNDEKVIRTISKLYAPIIGRVYTFALNGIPVTIYCDGKPHEYPKFIAEIIDRKINEISESNTYKEVIDERLDQGTY